MDSGSVVTSARTSSRRGRRGCDVFVLSKRFQPVPSVPNPHDSRTTCTFSSVPMGPVWDGSKSVGNPHGYWLWDTWDTLKGIGKKGNAKMTDKRRYGVIEVRRLNAETYHLTINGQMWSEVEWSASRRAWCIQDAAGRCLTHTEHIVGEDRDVQTAIRLAKRMIVDGRMPTPEAARQQLTKERLERDRLGEPLGEPWEPLKDTTKV